MDVVFWVCAIAGVALLVVGIVADGALDALPVGDDGTIVPAAGAFAAAFGIVGLVAGTLSGGNTAVALSAGLVGGLVLAVLAARLVRGAMRLRTDATPTSSDLLGRFGRVVTPIDGDAAGEVLVQLSGQRLKLFARAGGRLPVGTDVVVVEVLSPSSVLVEPESSFFEATDGGTPQ